jgi:hypothetical protein
MTWVIVPVLDMGAPKKAESEKLKSEMNRSRVAWQHGG